MQGPSHSVARRLDGVGEAAPGNNIPNVPNVDLVRALAGRGTLQRTFVVTRSMACCLFQPAWPSDAAGGSTHL